MQEQDSRARRDPAPAHALGVHPELIPLIQFFSIEIAPLAQGGFFAAVSATLCDDGDLSALSLGAHRAGTLREALQFVAETVEPATATLQ